MLDVKALTERKALTTGHKRKYESKDRNDRNKTLVELARQYTSDAIHALVMSLHNPQQRVTAACALLDRGWGRPAQAVNLSADSNILQLHLVAAIAASDELQEGLKKVMAKNGRGPVIDVEPEPNK